MDTNLRNFLFTISFTCTIILSSSIQGQKSFIYKGFTVADLNLLGNATIIPNRLLQLTNSQNQKGISVYKEPIKLSDSPTFSTTFAFAIYPHLSVLGGHGISFFLAPSLEYFNQTLGDQYLGLINFTSDGLPSNHLFAVELDTVKSPTFKDIDDNHVGIDVNSLISIQAASAAYFSEKEQKNISLTLKSGKPMQVWIDYDSNTTIVSVAIAPLGQQKPNKFLLLARTNLSEVLLDEVYVGLCASTSTLVSTHYILGWSFNQSGEAENLDPSKLPKLPKIPKEKKRVSPPLIALFTLVSLFLLLSVGAVYIVRRKKYAEVLEDWEKDYAFQRFAFKELYQATKGFKEKEILGSGGFGKVYKGVLPSNDAEVAVKRVSHDSRQGMREFVAEIASMRRLRHRNLVPLLGYCRRKSELLLVYDYMSNGSLDDFLFNKDRPVLSWPQRFKIIKGVASALLYLHEEWEQVVLHRDVKASNVMLDANMDARLGDFGLARLYDHGSDPQTTRLVGTVGYMAPEFSRKGKASTSTDVFAFGIFMLEVACGRRQIELEDLEDAVLVDWVLESWHRGVVMEATDPRLGREYIEEEMEMVLGLSLQCSQTRPEARPSMRQVVQFLNKDVQLTEVPLKSSMPTRKSASFHLPSYKAALVDGFYSR